MSCMNRAPVAITALLWLIASLFMSTATFFGQPNISGYGQIAGILYIVALIIYLLRTEPNAATLPDLQPLLLPGVSYINTLLLILGVLALLFLAGILLHPWLVLVAALSLVALWLIIKWRHHLSPRLVILGLAAGALCLLLSAVSGRLDGFQAFYLACIPLHFVAGGVLVQMTGLTNVRSVDGRWCLALQGFLWASLLAMPPALLNISGGAHQSDAWVDQLWKPLTALIPGIAEETWARLLLTTLLYALLRPASNQQPGRALMTAVLIGAGVHALVHLSGTMIFSPAALPALLNALLFGLPMGLLFVKRDFEHAVGYHFFIDFVRFVVAL